MSIKPNTAELLPIQDYDRIIVSYSGGKDSLACVLKMLDEGAKPEKMELWHQAIDGKPKFLSENEVVNDEKLLMDWECTEGYVRTTGKALGIKVRWQWKHGGFEREMLRKDALTAPVSFQLEDGTIQTTGGVRGKLSTRRKFPQVSADLSVRWCSAYLKIDVAAAAINNDPSFHGKKILFVTGERRQEGRNGKGRALYAEIEEHRCHSQRKRLVHQWRAVIDFTEEQVWDIIKRYKIQVHPAYYLGYGRVSCMKCVFSDHDQWATTHELDPKRVKRISLYEGEFATTIKKGISVAESIQKGKSFIPENMEKYRKLARSHEYPLEEFFVPEGQEWVMPAGAFKRCGGPI